MDPVHFEKTLSASRLSLGSFFRSTNLCTGAAEEQGYQDGGDAVHDIRSSETVRSYVGFNQMTASLISSFRFWHLCDMPTVLRNICFQGQSGRYVLKSSSYQFDPKRKFSSENGGQLWAILHRPASFRYESASKDHGPRGNA
jgi:hypothetical protein